MNQTLRTGDSRDDQHGDPVRVPDPAVDRRPTYSSTVTGPNGFMLSSGTTADASGGIGSSPG